MNKKYKFNKTDILIIQNFVNGIDDDIKVVQGKRWEVDQCEEIIYLGTKAPDRLKEYFYEWFSQQDFFIPIDSILFSLLHEIGHLQKGYSMEMLKERALLNNIYQFLCQQGTISGGN
jgi:hypothetical protein